MFNLHSYQKCCLLQIKLFCYYYYYHYYHYYYYNNIISLRFVFQALSLTGEDSPAKDYHFKMATCLGGLYIFYMCARLKKMWQISKKVKSQVSL